MNPLFVFFLFHSLFKLIFRFLSWSFRLFFRVLLLGRRTKTDLSNLPDDGIYRLEYICDGDTINVTNGEISFRVRLAGIDAPEKSQPFGAESTRFLSSLLPKNSLVHLAIVDYDSKWDRVVAYVENAQDDPVNQIMVEMGFAYHFKDFAKKAKFLAQAEKLARKEKRGLWALNLKEKPWEYRQKSA